MEKTRATYTVGQAWPNNDKEEKVRELVSEGWSLDQVMEYFMLLDDFAGINAVIKVRRKEHE
jgi:hypothetical protein